MGSTLKSRQKLPLWELWILLAFFLGLAILARVPAVLGNQVTGMADKHESQAVRSDGE